MGELARDIFTIPNTITATKLALVPYVAGKLETEPRAWWVQSGALVFTDAIDGSLARLGNRSEKLESIGFRSSSTGEILDHVGDKFTIPRFIIAGLRSNVIPKAAGAVALTQKAAIAAYTVNASRRGAKIEVSKLGKYSEFVTNLGFGTMFAWESCDNPSLKDKLRTTSLSVAALGIAAALAANSGYVRQVREQLAEQ